MMMIDDDDGDDLKGLNLDAPESRGRVGDLHGGSLFRRGPPGSSGE